MIQVLRKPARELQIIDAAKERAAIPGPVIESGVPMPRGFWRSDGVQASLRLTLASLPVGHSFIWSDNSAPYRAAKDIGAKIKVRKEDGKGWRVWRVE